MSHVYGRYLYGSALVHPSMYEARATISAMSTGRGSMDPVCLDYIHFLALYRPERQPLDDMLATLWKPDKEIAEQCAIELAEGLEDVADERGVPTRQIKREFRGLKKNLPNVMQLMRQGYQKASSTLVAAHRKLLPSTPEGRTLIAKREAEGRPIV